jgi:dTMP kinase
VSETARGKFVTFEGGEGAGKSTQVARLVAWLHGRGVTAIATREPGGSAGAEAIRELLVTGEPGRWDGLTEALLISAARRDHVQRLIEPQLRRGVWVVSDRFFDSTLAYQGFGQGVARTHIAALQRAAVGELVPDLTLILDLPVEQAHARARARSGGLSRFERMDRAFHERIRQGFIEIAQAEPKRCTIIDAAADMDNVTQAVHRLVARRLGVT